MSLPNTADRYLIWEVDPKSKGFAYCMIDYYLNIRSQSTSKAPFNMWPHMLKFALTEPTLIYRSKITNDGNIITDVFPSKNNTYSDVLLPLSSYSGSTTISVANINFVVFDLFFLPILTNLRQNAHKELVSVQK